MRLTCILSEFGIKRRTVIEWVPEHSESIFCTLNKPEICSTHIYTYVCIIK